METLQIILMSLTFASVIVFMFVELYRLKQTGRNVCTADMLAIAVIICAPSLLYLLFCFILNDMLYYKACWGIQTIWAYLFIRAFSKHSTYDEYRDYCNGAIYTKEWKVNKTINFLVMLPQILLIAAILGITLYNWGDSIGGRIALIIELCIAIPITYRGWNYAADLLED